MSPQQLAESPIQLPTQAGSPTDTGRPASKRSFWHKVGNCLPGLLALGAVGLLCVVGQTFGWSVPKLSILLGQATESENDWCSEHSVPESICVECNKELVPTQKQHGWCKKHGVHECPLCHPEVAQLATPPEVTAEDRVRAESALAFAARTENTEACTLHHRRLQIASAEIAEQLGIKVAPVGRALVTESIVANGEIDFDPTKIVRLSTRVPGLLWRVEKQVGDKVRQGDVLALVDALEIGKAKGEFQQALGNLEYRVQALANLKASEGAIAGKLITEAESLRVEAQVRVLAAHQALRNLGFQVTIEECKNLAPALLTQKLQFLGLPSALIQKIRPQTTSHNLFAVLAPFDGEVIERLGTQGEMVDPSKVLFVLADTRKMKLTLQVRLEDVERLEPGLQVKFRHEGHEAGDPGTIVWISPSVEEKARTVPVRVDLPNAYGGHQAKTFGTGTILLREEPKALVVPSSAVHWEGDCNIVFVRDKNYESSPYKLFHVRKVRPGAKLMTKEGPLTEIVVGVLPGELVATANSGILRGELLKNNLGAG